MDGRIQTIVDDLYAGTMDDDAWHRGVLGIAHLVRGASAVIFGINPLTERTFRAESHDFGQQLLDEFCTQWFDREIRLQPALHCPIGEPIFDAKLMPLKTWRNSEIYNEFLRRIDKPWFLCFWLHKNVDKFSILAIHGSRQRGPLDQRDGELVRPLIPHLRRALEIRDRLTASQVRAVTLASSLDQSSFGVIILDAKGRILEVSAAAQLLMTKESGIRRNPDGTLWLRRPAGAQLDRWILTGLPPSESVDGLLHVPRANRRPISIVVTGLPMMSPTWIGGDPRWMLLSFDPDRKVMAHSELIARDLGVSDREAEIAALLVDGSDLKQIAARLGISINTTRTHLKSIFGKTGIRSQAELIRRVASGPAVLVPNRKPAL